MAGKNSTGMKEIFEEISKWFSENTSILNQAAISIFLFIISLFAARWINKKIDVLLAAEGRKRWHKTFLSFMEKIMLPFVCLFAFYLYFLLAGKFGWDSKLIYSLLILLSAWFVIRFFSSFVEQTYIIKLVTFITLSIAALGIFGALDDVLNLLQSLSIDFGETTISLYAIIKGLTILVVLLWATTAASGAAEVRLNRIKKINPSLRVLFGKLLKIILISLAIVISLNTVGIDLTGFAIFSGAVGVGLGFGLQKVVSNFISGIILLADNSIKPGDVIAIGDTYGWVNSLGARYVSVITRDGKEHLIPNELLITEKVENWSFSNDAVRIRIPIGISYKSDIDKATKLMLESIADTKRILKEPEPKCFITGFGDSSVDFELRGWINDPTNGIGNVKDEIYRRIWKKFKENNIEIPFPQRDIHIKEQANG